MKSSRGISRRDLLKFAGIGVTGAALAACVPASQTSAPVEAGDGAAPSEASVAFAYWFTGGTTWEDFYTQAIFPEFNERYPNAEIEYTILGSWTDLYNKLVTAAAGGAPPEVARQKDFFTPDFAVRNILEPIDDYVATSDHIVPESYLPLAWENSQWDGKMVAMPLHIFIHYLHMSDVLFEQAGLMNDDGTPQVPDTWEDFVEAATAISDPDNGVYGTMLRSYGGQEDTVNFFQVILAQAGGELVDANYENFLFNSPEGLEALQFQVDLINNGLSLPPGAPTEGFPSNDKVGMWYHAANYWPGYLNNDPDFQWHTAINPINQTRGAVLRANHQVLFSGAAEKDMGWNFLSFHAEPDNDYLYAQNANYFTARTDNWDRPMYAGNYEGREGAVYATEIEQYNLAGNQPQPIFPGYQESTFKIGAQLMEAYLGEKSPEEALAQAEIEGNAVLMDVRSQLGV